MSWLFGRTTSGEEGLRPWFRIAAKAATAITLLIALSSLFFSVPANEVTALWTALGTQPSQAKTLVVLNNRQEAQRLDQLLMMYNPPASQGSNIAPSTTAFTTSNAFAERQASDFERSALPQSCRLDYDYCLTTCDRNANGRIDLRNQREVQCQAFCTRQAVQCEKDTCQEKIQETKRSALLWGVGLFLVGILVASISQPLGFLIAGIGFFLFGLSVAPFFDMINFLNCR